MAVLALSGGALSRCQAAMIELRYGARHSASSAEVGPLGLERRSASRPAPAPASASKPVASRLDAAAEDARVRGAQQHAPMGAWRGTGVAAVQLAALTQLWTPAKGGRRQQRLHARQHPCSLCSGRQRPAAWSQRSSRCSSTLWTPRGISRRPPRPPSPPLAPRFLASLAPLSAHYISLCSSRPWPSRRAHPCPSAESACCRPAAARLCLCRRCAPVFASLSASFS